MEPKYEHYHMNHPHGFDNAIAIAIRSMTDQDIIDIGIDKLGCGFFKYHCIP